MDFTKRIALINELVYNARKMEHFTKENFDGVLLDSDIEDKRQKLFDYYKTCYNNARQQLIDLELQVENDLQNAKNDYVEIPQARIID